MSLIVTCKGCAQKNRIPVQNVPPGQRKPVRCGKCKRGITDLDMMEARIASSFPAGTRIEFRDPNDGDLKGALDL
jgi:hypothetical protein